MAAKREINSINLVRKEDIMRHTTPLCRHVPVAMDRPRVLRVRKLRRVYSNPTYIETTILNNSTGFIKYSFYSAQSRIVVAIVSTYAYSIFNAWREKKRNARQKKGKKRCVEGMN